MWSLTELFPKDCLINILDIGAALGERPSYQSLIDSKRARLIGFEPNAEECRKLNSTYGAPHQFFPHFVGDGKPAIFHETNKVLTGSLYPPNTAVLEKFQSLAEFVTPVAQHPITTVRLDDIPEIGDVDFIKIDVQGSELPIFQNGERILSKTLFIQTEVEFVELYKGQPMFADVDIFLRQQGFQFHTFQGLAGRTFKPLIANKDINAPLRQVLWADAVFVRDLMQFEALDENKLFKFAVIAHDIFNSFDLAHLALTELDRHSGMQYAATYLARLMQK